MNPYKILNINSNVTQADIILSVTTAMRERKYSAGEIARAQKELLNPVSKAAHAFIQFLDIEPLLTDIDLTPPKLTPPDTIERLSLFDENV
ncbi:hypothetical protein QUF75_03630 [Desulfococcaceae bacterium HSG7]|nr:hypothetical protein [Desulfococcaceae bacterium HSG7]